MTFLSGDFLALYYFGSERSWQNCKEIRKVKMGALSSCLVKSDCDRDEERKEVFDKTHTSINFVLS